MCVRPFFLISFSIRKVEWRGWGEEVTIYKYVCTCTWPKWLRRKFPNVQRHFTSSILTMIMSTTDWMFVLVLASWFMQNQQFEFIRISQFQHLLSCQQFFVTHTHNGTKTFLHRISNPLIENVGSLSFVAFNSINAILLYYHAIIITSSTLHELSECINARKWLVWSEYVISNIANNSSRTK